MATIDKDTHHAEKHFATCDFDDDGLDYQGAFEWYLSVR